MGGNFEYRGPADEYPEVTSTETFTLPGKPGVYTRLHFKGGGMVQAHMASKVLVPLARSIKMLADSIESERPTKRTAESLPQGSFPMVVRVWQR